MIYLWFIHDPKGNAKSSFVIQVFLSFLRHTRRRQWQPTPVLLPGKPHGQRSLVGCSPWGGEESDTTERLHFHISLSCIGEGNGNPLQCSCLENPRDGGAWWAQTMGSHRVGHDWNDLAAARHTNCRSEGCHHPGSLPSPPTEGTQLPKAPNCPGSGTDT